MPDIILLLHNIRSAHNVGAILRSADAFGVTKVFVSGYTPYPLTENDSRLPYIAAKNTKDIAKTALGAEKTIKIEVSNDIAVTIESLKRSGIQIIALEQDATSASLEQFSLEQTAAILIGEERYGITNDLLKLCDTVLEIPMMGNKESLNVSVATSICLYQLRYG